MASEGMDAPVRVEESLDLFLHTDHTIVENTYYVLVCKS